MKPKVLVTGIIPEKGLTQLRAECEVFYQPEIETRAWVLKHLSEYDGLLLAGMSADPELLAAGSNLKIVTTNGVGFDHVDLGFAQQQGIIITNCPQSVQKPTAEMTLALLLATVRRLHFYDQALRQQQWLDVSQAEYMGMSLQDRVLGIYGLGRIGSQVAQLAQALGMKVIYHQRHPLTTGQEQEQKVHYVDFSTLVRQADVLTLHAPAVPETTGIIDALVFDQMKPTAYLINTARGALVKQEDLIKALQQGKIAGAGLDVFEDEPHLPAALTKLDNVVLTPHAGTGTLAARTAIAQEASQNLIAYLCQGKILHQVQA
ncbi:dihydrofolate reductase [Lactobacillus sp. DCY120]|uniref:Dihydrofolate reductase n=1 Tax=Bombilactobacillus apium TaxID=2675299 RepID=A0A850R5V4_9LACO|nr:NAD(P)-dependent oxidoreductase [Bombilactobacillus apium]NVY95925.1 dihydrofolate reductase [Bombilactobacillus apium]